ncbi:MAG: DUF58 domain-containing protein [Planctomycetes bacterium]|nr:DUF58 domain-containing protein [Planctomycetota bacterium]
MPLSPYLDPQALTRLANLQLVARAVVEGFVSGLHRSPFHGHSVEFAEYREYIPGDDLKHFDWRIYARSERGYIRQYQEETNLRAHLLLDCSASMAYASRGISKWRYACFLAASLAYLMIRQQDAVGLCLFDDEIRAQQPARSTVQHLRNLLTVIEKATTTRRTAIPAVLHAMAEQVQRRGLVVLFSDLLDEPEEIFRGLAHFQHYRHEVIVFHLFDPAEIDFPFEGMTEFRDLETGERMDLLAEWYADEYRARLGEFVAQCRRRCREARIDYQMLPTSAPFDIALRNYLRKRTRLR